MKVTHGSIKVELSDEEFRLVELALYAAHKEESPDIDSPDREKITELYYNWNL